LAEKYGAISVIRNHVPTLNLKPTREQGQ